MSELRNRIFDRKYRLVRLLDEGGMGSVYEAEHVLLHRRVALKVLHPELSSHAEAVERFVREAQAASAIGHPNIIEIYDVGREDDGTTFIVMELLRGQDLGSLLVAEGKLQPARAIGLALQMLSALHDAHAKGIIHRDMKPENVFLALDARMREEVKLLDFGVAKFKLRSGHEERLALTQTGVTLGTPYYLSPEQARGRRNIDERIDLWSVGVMLYEMLAGCRPFEGDGYNQILSSVLIEEPRPLREVAPEVPERLAVVVDRALQKDRDWRYQSAGEMIGDLLLFFDRDASEGLTSSVVQALFSCRDQGESFAATTRRRSAPPAGKNGRGADTWLLNSDIPEVVPQRRPVARWLGIAGVVGAFALAAVIGVLLLGRADGAPETAAPAPAPAAASQPHQRSPATTAAPAPDAVRIEIVGVPAGARIELDGQPVGETVTRPRSSAPQILKVTADGFRPFAQAVVFERDQRIEPELAPLPAAESERERSRPARKRRAKRKSLLAENPFGN